MARVWDREKSTIYKTKWSDWTVEPQCREWMYDFVRVPLPYVEAILSVIKVRSVDSVRFLFLSSFVTSRMERILARYLGFTSRRSQWMQTCFLRFLGVWRRTFSRCLCFVLLRAASELICSQGD
jgi:hypothetical protein